MLVKSLVAGTVLTLLAGGVVYYGTDLEGNASVISEASKAAPIKTPIKKAEKSDADTTLHAEANTRHPHTKKAKTEAREASSDENMSEKHAAATTESSSDIPSLKTDTQALIAPKNAAVTVLNTENMSDKDMADNVEELSEAPEMATEMMAENTVSTEIKTDVKKEASEENFKEEVIKTPHQTPPAPATPTPKKPGKKWIDHYLKPGGHKNTDAPKEVMETKATPTAKPAIAETGESSLEETVSARIDALLMPKERTAKDGAKTAEAPVKQMENIWVKEEGMEKESVNLHDVMKNHDNIRKAHKDKMTHNLEEKIAEDGNIKMETKTIDLDDGRTITIVERDQMDMPTNPDKGSKQIRIKVMTDDNVDLDAIPEVIKMGDGTKIKIRKHIMDSQEVDTKDIDINVSEISPNSDISKTAQLIMAQAEKINMSELRDRAYLDLVSYALDNGDTQTANLAMAKIEQVELRDTARNRMAVSFAENGQAEKAFAILEDIEVEALRDVMRLQVIEALIAPEILEPSNIE